MLPNFLVIGAMKAGTTALYRHLRFHPQVFMASPKELDFFVDAGNWHRGLAWFEDHFAAAGDAVARGEVSPNYSKAHSSPEASARIARLIPDARLTYLVRHPIDRIRSMHAHLVADGVETRTINRAVSEDDDYVLTSSYAYQLDAYREHFPKENILVLQSERLRSQPQRVLAEVSAFLGVDPGLGSPERIDANLARRRRQPLAVAGKLESYRPYWNLLNRSWRFRKLHELATSRPLRPPESILLPDVEAELVAKLQTDMRRLRSYLGAEFDGWGIA